MKKSDNTSGAEVKNAQHKVSEWLRELGMI